jgi:hypothetical protein
MLTIQMPGGHEAGHRHRRRQALGYLIAGVLILASLFVAYTSNWWYLTVAVEAWWLWAVSSWDPRKESSG